MLAQGYASTTQDESAAFEYHTAKWITELLKEVGIPVHLHGYRYLTDAVQLTISLPEMCINLSHQLYPCIAKRYHTTPSCVERSIRHAIDLAWQRGSLRAVNGMFGRTINLAYDKPTNSEMIALLAEKISLKLYESNAMDL